MSFKSIGSLKCKRHLSLKAQQSKGTGGRPHNVSALGRHFF